MKPYLLALFIILQVGDAVTTLNILRRGGRERFWVMRWMIEKLGVESALMIKTVIAIALFWVIVPIAPLWVLAGLCGWYVVIVVMNFMVLNKMKARV
jgi:hypothetical protein